MQKLRWLVAVAVVQAGCGLYFGGGGGGGDTCTPPSTVALRDVDTGQCFTPADCCTQTCPGPVMTGPDFFCNGPCDNLGEAQCLASSSCHAEYDTSGPGPGVGTAPVFTACWNIAPQTPVQGAGTDCEGLDTFSCAIHTDCVSEIHRSGDGGVVGGACSPIGTCATVNCGSDAYCQLTCTGAACVAMCVPTQTCADIKCPTGQSCSDVCDSNGVCLPVCM